MPRNRRRKRRSNFVTFTLESFATADISAILKRVRNGSACLRQNVVFNAQAEQLAEKAIEEAEERTQLFFPCIRSQMTAAQLVGHLHKTMFNLGIISVDFSPYPLAQSSSDEDLSLPILRCQIRPIKGFGLYNANVTVRTYQMAEKLVEASPISLGGTSTRIELSDRPEITGSIRRVLRDGLDCPTYQIGRLQFGFLESSRRFRSLWCSYENFFSLKKHVNGVDPMDAIIQVNPSERLISIVTVHPFQMSEAETSSSLARTLARLRIEIPFHAIYASPVIQEIPDDSRNRAVCVPMSHTPFIFREHEFSIGTAQNDLYWDISASTFNPLEWVRTLDSTSEKAISRASSIRFDLSVEKVGSLLCQLRRMGVACHDKIRPRLVQEIPEPAMHSLHARFQNAAVRYNISFAARYMVECILSFKNIDAIHINHGFWSKLSQCRSERKIQATLKLMYVHVSGTAFSVGLNPELFENLMNEPSSDKEAVVKNPYAILRKCMKICGATAITTREADSADNMDDDSTSSESGFSIYSVDSDDFALEDALQSLSIVDSSSLSTATTRRSKYEYEMFKKKKKRSKHEALIRRVSVTPTRIVCNPPEVDLLNRVLRQFSEHKDRFIRVTFCDEDGCPISHRSTPDLMARISKVLLEGIQIAGETFVFLAFSNSQLRDHSVWMYNQKPNSATDLSQPPTADEIRKWMGDFSSIQIPGKFASRQGQAFSSTVSTVGLDDINRQVVPDIIDASGKYMFSDGIGLVKHQLALKMARQLRLKSDQRIPSAFQVRFGGAKGMLTVWDDAFPPETDPSIWVIIRESMDKFDCGHREVEVVGYSKRMPLFLNRQIIALLSAHGVPDNSFEKLQSKALKTLDCAMTKDGAKYALRLLTSTGGERSAELISSGTGTNLASFFQAGLTCVSCEHLFNMMLACRHRTIRDMMNRGRIPIDPDKGLCALGVLDELGILRSRELFCRYTDPKTGRLKVLTGPVTVGRNPCLHPGDVQPVEAVDREELHHLVDVIVFPKTGYRPIPSMLSGGDLDGDIYFCIFDDSIALPRRQEIKPMDYSSPPPIKVARKVTWVDVAEFFISFIDNDRVGIIANAHVVQADKQASGIHSDQCLKLAHLHSEAVDFPKTGVSVAPKLKDTSLLPRHRSNEYPDFMGKHRKVSYQSDKILGKLYRRCLAHKAKHDDSVEFKFRENEESYRVHEIFESIATGTEMLEEAKETCELYNAELRTLMVRYGIINEGEIISGNILNFENGPSKIKGYESHHSILMRVNRQVKKLQESMREEFFLDIDEDNDEHKILKASAWYSACRQIALRDSRESPGSELLSFPWVVSDILLRIIEAELDLQTQAYPLYAVSTLLP